MHDKPVLITSFDADQQRDYWDSARRLMDYPHLKTLRGLEGVRVVSGFPELESELRLAIAHPEFAAGARGRALAAECLSADGCSTERVLAVLTRSGEGTSHVPV